MYNLPARKMATQPNGDVSQLPKLPDDPSETDAIRLAMQLLGSAAQYAGHWVGLNAPILISMLEELPFNSLMHPGLWMRVLGNNSKIAACFRIAERAGLITISDSEAGYFYEPTQPLVDMMLQAENSTEAPVFLCFSPRQG